MVLRLFHQAALAFVSLMVVFYQHFFFVNHPRAPELMSLNGWVNMEFYLLLIGFFFRHRENASNGMGQFGDFCIILYMLRSKDILVESNDILSNIISNVVEQMMSCGQGNGDGCNYFGNGPRWEMGTDTYGYKDKGEAVAYMVICCILYILDFRYQMVWGGVGRRSSWLVASYLLGLGIKRNEWIVLNQIFGAFDAVISNLCFFFWL